MAARGNRARRAIAAAVAVAVAIAIAAAPGSGAPAPAPSIARCAFGTEIPELRGYLPKAVDSAASAYAAGLQGADAATRDRARRVFAAAAAAYVYGMPQVTVRGTVKRFPHNELISIAKLATPKERTVVAPNNDTAYTVAWFDLTSGPMVIDVPDTGGRYYTFELLDAFTDAFSYIGHRTTGTKAGSYALVPPGWRGDLPAGVTRIDSPSNTVLLIGRTLVHGDADMPAAKSVMQKYTATQLAAWSAGQRQPPAVLDDFPPMLSQPTVPTGGNFIAALNRSLEIDPPPAADSCALAAMAPAGVRLPQGTPAGEVANELADIPPPGPDIQSDPVVKAALDAGTAAGSKIVDGGADELNANSRDRNNGWEVLLGWIGRYGQRYLGRAVVARIGLGANVPEESIYPIAVTDVDGQPLDGSKRYTIRFAKGELPPARAFWSLTMYGADYFMYENEIHRYAIGDRTDGLHFAPDGSLTLYVQHDKPADPGRRANWLPAPAGPFRLMLRIYEPSPPAFSGVWKPAAVEAAGSLPRISGLRVAPKRVRSVRRARITYSATRAGTTTFTLTRRARQGRSVRLRFRHRDRVGTNRVRLPSRRLSRGRYVLRAVPRSDSGAAGPAQRARFSVR